MISSVLGQLLVLLAFAILVMVAFRRFELPPVLAYLAVGLLLGPHALDLAGSDETTRLLAELGVVFLVFTLGLEFSLPRMLAMRWEVLGLGGSQVLLTSVLLAIAVWAVGAPPLVAVVIGGALAMSSTAIVIRQLGEQLETNSTHGRLAVGILLFQDLAFVPFLALEGALKNSADGFDLGDVAGAIARAAVALLIVLVGGRYLLRPLFHEIGRARSTELFTLAALFVSLGAAWATHEVGLSLALGAFLAGMLLAETEYRHQVEIVIRPFRDILLGLFFITIGMLLDLRLLASQLVLVLALVLGLLVIKTVIVTVLSYRIARDWRKAARTGIVMAQGGEFGFALLTLMLNDRLAGPELIQPLLAATVVSMALSPLLIRHNRRIADLLLRRPETPASTLERELIATQDTASRDHVVICGFGRVGQNLARVLEKQGFEYLALDMDPTRVREARQAGDPVVYGDAAEPEILEAMGLQTCSVLVITFASPGIALNIIETARELRPDVPILVRTQDDTHLDALQKAGATEVVPETFEASLMLASHLLMLLQVPISNVVRVVGDIRGHRYSMLRRVFPRGDARYLDGSHALREVLHTVILPPGAFAVGKSLGDLPLERADVTITALRREGIVGRQPGPETVLREGDVVVLFGTPEALEHGESLLLGGR
ncbi:MAG TPA: cation:proton antiporter [Steroidobacteraceae bacterium]|nr:cation:proton antiporter [Steroidobacteraceae bacterium]